METNKQLQKTSVAGIEIETKEQFAQRFEPVSMTREFASISSIGQAIAADSNSIAYYRNKFSQNQVFAMIEAHLLSLNNSLNTHDKLNEVQIIEIAVEINASYYYLSPVEIHYVLRKAKRGDFGKIDYAINMPDVLSWFEIYTEERARHFMTGQLDNHAQHKGYSETMEQRKINERHEKLREDEQ